MLISDISTEYVEKPFDCSFSFFINKIELKNELEPHKYIPVSLLHCPSPSTPVISFHFSNVYPQSPDYNAERGEFCFDLTIDNLESKLKLFK